jgi:hypothetical protein
VRREGVLSGDAKVPDRHGRSKDRWTNKLRVEEGKEGKKNYKAY